MERLTDEQLKEFAHHFGMAQELALEVLELRARERWLIMQLVEGEEHRCPMPDEHCQHALSGKCHYKNDKTRSLCWRNAAKKAVKN